MSETHMILCGPAPGPGHDIPGSVQIKADCGHQVYVAPTGMQMILNPVIKTATRCLNCITPEQLREIVAEGKMREIPGAREEAADIIGEEATDRIYDALRTKKLGE